MDRPLFCPRKFRPRMPHRRRGAASAALGVACLLAAPALAQEKKDTKPPTSGISGAITVAVPGALAAANLAKSLADGFKKRTGVTVRIAARRVDDGLDMLAGGKAEVAIADDPAAEDAAVKAKRARDHRTLLYTELLIVGPGADPADVKGMVSVIDALKAIASAEAVFLSRGDGSGIHRAERRFWAEAGLAPAPSAQSWYRRVRTGMAKLLERAVAGNAYAVADRASWLALKKRGKLRALVSGDPRMELRYGVLVAPPKKGAKQNLTAARAFAAWATGSQAQAIIDKYLINRVAPYIAHHGLQR